MAFKKPWKRLRTYLLVYFIPLTGLPLLVLSVMTYFLLGQAFRDEIYRRSQFEVNSLYRQLDSVERRAAKELAESSKNLRSFEAPETQLRALLEDSIFDEYRFFSSTGRLTVELKRKDQKKGIEKWNQFFGPALNAKGRKPADDNSASEATGDSDERVPASKSKNSQAFILEENRFDRIGGRDLLSEDFKEFIKNDESWFFRTVDEGKGLINFVFYKVIFDQQFKSYGFIEANIAFDADKFKLLAKALEVDLVLLNSNFLPLLSSSNGAESKLKLYAKELKKISDKQDIRKYHRDVEVDQEKLSFFFAPFPLEVSDAPIWVSLGIDRGPQVDMQNKVIFWMSLLALALGGLVVVMAIRVSNRITQPVSNLVDAVELIKQGEWAHPVEVDSDTEIGILVRRFNEMVQSVQVTKRTLELKLEELAKAHTDLTLTQDQLVQSAKLSSLGQLVAGVAHELNNPIAFIYSNMSQMKLYLNELEQVSKLIETMKKEMPKEREAEIENSLKAMDWEFIKKDISDMIQSCLEGSVRVKDIVLGLRNFSRLDKGDFKEIEINQLLKDTAKLLSSQIKNKVELHWNLCEDSHAVCNPVQMNQVFVNLLANAAQAISDRGDIWVSTLLDTPRETMIIVIRDNGKGIPQENLQKIFDPFFTTKKVGEGTGLGLSIVYGIIERHRGTIAVRSETNMASEHGTIFEIRIPRTQKNSLEGQKGNWSKAS